MVMDIMSSTPTLATSSLNPNAPLFVPRAYQAVEDYSDEWWELIQSSPCFRDYWLRECFQDPQFDDHHFDEAVFDAFTTQDEEDVEEEEEIEKNYYKDLISFGVLKWRKSQGLAEKSPKYEKAPKFVKMQVKPRPIQQPR
ncbi:hypothetical protein MKW94_004119 [Papaver nudicaule]|uniref:Ataxin-2 C-terminal domain-containing protein n=1 Tax=Papaver nudicaule TaxID=74823 RepID=A0AA41UVN2_PAPNU|nr:hypothetical protein [Papaver nudicaule]